MKRLIIIVLVMGALEGIAQSKLTRHYKKLLGVETVNGSTAGNFVKIDLVDASKAKPLVIQQAKKEPKTVFSLDTASRKEYIKAYLKEAEHDKFNKKSVTDILCYKCGSTPAAAPSPSLLVDKTKFTKVFEFDVKDVFGGTSKKGRIADLTVTLTLDNTDDVEFLSFVNLSTKHETVEFGDISLTRNRNFTLNAGFELAGTGGTTITTGATNSSVDTLNDGSRVLTVGDSSENVDSQSQTSKNNIGASFGSSRAITEARKITERVIAMKGSISNRSFTIYQEGAPGRNLNDHIRVEVILASKNVVPQQVFLIGSLFDGNTAITDPNKLSLDQQYVDLPPLGASGNISGKLNFQFNYREAVSKAGAPEAEQKVKFHHLDDASLVETSVDVMTKDELAKTNIYSLSKNPGQASMERVFIEFRGRKVALRLMSLNKTDELLSYFFEMNKADPDTKVIDYGGMKLFLGKDRTTNRPLTKGDLKDLLVTYL